MNHRATPRFWSCYRRLPEFIQRQADRDFQLLRNDPRHPSPALKKSWSILVRARGPALSRLGRREWLRFGLGVDWQPFRV